MKTMLKMLKVKVKSLTAEARIIRLEESRARRDDPLRCSLHLHRVGTVRQEQRLSLLAYGFLRGRPYDSLERTPKFPPDWARVSKLVEKFGVVDYTERKAQADRLEQWRSAKVPAC